VRGRNVGTIGGNLCFGDPHADPASALLVHDTRVKIGTHSGDRTIGLEAFYIGLYETAIAPDEILIALQVEPLPPGMGSASLRAAHFEHPSLGWLWPRPSMMDASSAARVKRSPAEAGSGRGGAKMALGFPIRYPRAVCNCMYGSWIPV
jgi:FAD binding domain in molybdopterin dehydrogenase